MEHDKRLSSSPGMQRKVSKRESINTAPLYLSIVSYGGIKQSNRKVTYLRAVVSSQFMK